ncbi:FOG: RCC1 domain [Phaffia rhodozyma]|uniref:FOG: RCC1 domain n=1 Tax=Phaffia rhodozyma TaxID=264483 RepID=A0A0F7SG01_PHARH|nr:FOG: RCC1 domain [Phaffia rhodozyma]
MESIEVATYANTTSSHLVDAPERHQLALLLGILLPILVLLAISACGWKGVKPVVETKPNLCCQTDVENMAESFHPLARLKNHNPNLEIFPLACSPTVPTASETPYSPTLTLSLSLIRKVRSPLGGLITRLTGRSRTPSINTIDTSSLSSSSVASPSSAHETDSSFESGSSRVTPVAISRDVPEVKIMSFDTVTPSTGLVSFSLSNDRYMEPHGLSMGMSVSTGSGILQSGVGAKGEEAEIGDEREIQNNYRSTSSPSSPIATISQHIMSSLDNLPDELFLDNILPILPLTDLLSLSRVNKHIKQVVQDQTFWKRKIREDFNLPLTVTAREDGWKDLYLKLRRPSVYVWGSLSNGRLGLPRSHPALADFTARIDGINRPVLLPLNEGVGMVDLQASGYGFCGLDSQGRIWCWGTLDGESYTASRLNWMDPATVCTQPHQILVPSKVLSISCGRKHVLILDADNIIWELTAWGKALKFDSESSSNDCIVQVEAGWTNSASLSSSGRVRVWWPDYEAPNPPPPSPLSDSSAAQIPLGITVSSAPMFMLPEIEENKIVQIACGDSFLVALTEKGEVWTAWLGSKVDDIGKLSTGNRRQIWEHHPKFQYPQAPRPTLEPYDYEYQPYNITRMTHVSAHFETFFVYYPGTADSDYSTSIVYKGTKSQLLSQSSGGVIPSVLKELQGRGVIKVALGDYHVAVLTAKGELSTFGQANSGSLGLGPISVQRVDTPTVVQFGEPKTAGPDGIGTGLGTGKFVFGITASGWHTGALIVDLSTPSPEPKPASNQRMKLAPTPSHPTLPDHPDTSRFTNLDPPPSGRPIPGVVPGSAGFRTFLPGVARYTRVGLAGARGTPGGINDPPREERETM